MRFHVTKTIFIWLCNWLFLEKAIICLGTFLALMLKIEAQKDLFPGIGLWGFLSINSFCNYFLPCRVRGFSSRIDWLLWTTSVDLADEININVIYLYVTLRWSDIRYTVGNPKKKLKTLKIHDGKPKKKTELVTNLSWSFLVSKPQGGLPYKVTNQHVKIMISKIVDDLPC